MANISLNSDLSPKQRQAIAWTNDQNGACIYAYNTTDKWNKKYLELSDLFQSNTITI